jgi:hypothetical protein
MKIFAAFPSKYLKAADLHDKHVQAVMSHVLLEELVNKDGAELCPILYFNGVQKGMVLNKTNAKTIAAAYGDETDAWAGKPIVLFPAMVSWGAETVEAIRMKVPPPRHGGPTAHERRQNYINSTPDPAATAERMGEAWAEEQAARLLRGMRAHAPEPALVSLDNAVVWEADHVRPATPEDDLDIPAILDRRPKREPSLKERLLAAIPDLGSVRDVLHYSLEMSKFDQSLSPDDRDEIAGALAARKKVIALNGGGAHA